MGKTIRTERRGRIVVAHLDNPPHALMNRAMVAELGALVREADADDGIGVVVLTGAHPERFLAHYDVSELLRASQQSPPVSAVQARAALKVTGTLGLVPGVRRLLGRTPLAGLTQLQAFHDTLLRMGRSGTIWIAAINGTTAGGGLELAMACDFRYLADNAELAQPEVLLGFPPGGGGTQRLARLIGRARALELMLTGRAVSAAEAKSLGLVTDVFLQGRFMEFVMAAAERLATRPKAAVAVVKQCVLEGGSLPLDEGLAVEQAGFLAMLGTKHAKAAMTAYLEHLERTGKLPAADPEARQRLEDGSFVRFD